MYIVLKKKFPNDYPTKRFVGSWLRRQVSNQVNRKPPKSSPGHHPKQPWVVALI
jgi:hypothetical protein